MKQEDIVHNILLSLDQFKGNVSSFKQAVLKGDYSPGRAHFSRTLVWKVSLITDSLDIKTWEQKLGETRIVWQQLSTRDEFLVPWSKLPADSGYYQKGTTSMVRIETTTDPLSNPGDDVDLLETIIMDIDRLFPGVPFFNLPHSIKYKKMVISLLYVWARANSSIGYKQGFHEIVGLILVNLYKESCEVVGKQSENDGRILTMFNRKFLAHDVFTIFNRFVVDGGIIGLFFELEDALWRAIDKFNVQLMKVDQVIHYNLISKLKLESQLWIIRYLRLMLIREVGDLATVLLVWDRLIAAKLLAVQLPDMFNFMVISLLIQVKTELMACDFSELLSLLLHYPIEKRVELPRQRHEFVSNLISDGYALYQLRENDLGLYETGNKLNQRYNPDLKITMNVSGDRLQQMKVEKTRLELRLKRRAQAITGQK